MVSKRSLTKRTFAKRSLTKRSLSIVTTVGYITEAQLELLMTDHK
jgi:hypothetical protein